MQATKVIGLLTAVFMATFLFGGLVYAEPPVGGEPQGDDQGEIAPVVPEGNDDVAADESSWSCYAKIDNPHYSGHAANRGEDKVNVVGRVNCTEIMSLIQMRVTLHTKTCVLKIFCTTEQVADSTWIRHFATNRMTMNADTLCVENRYFGRMSVYVAGYDGAVGEKAFISNTVQVTCG